MHRRSKIKVLLVRGCPVIFERWSISSGKFVLVPSRSVLNERLKMLKGGSFVILDCTLDIVQDRFL